MTDWTPVTLGEDNERPVVVESWNPVVGQRVRYRWQPECPGTEGLLAPVGHPLEFDGQMGTVYEKLGTSRWAGHPYLVRLDGDIGIRHVQCAALELEPV